MREQLQWISWWQPGDDYRPLTYPPNAGVLGWWCTGYDDSESSLVAMVIAPNESAAREVVKKDWPDAHRWRFCKAVDNPTLSDRFPIDGDWMQERFDAWHAADHA